MSVGLAVGYADAAPAAGNGLLDNHSTPDHRHNLCSSQLPETVICNMPGVASRLVQTPKPSNPIFYLRGTLKG